MRKFCVLINSRNALNLAIAGLAAALMSGCSSDASRFSDPFSNPFSSSTTSVSQNTQTNYSGAPVGRVRSQSLASRGSSSSTSVAYNEPRPSKASPVGGGGKGWSTAGGTPIVVAQGETVSVLAQRYGVPDKALLKANGFESAREVRAGTRLVIPVYRGRNGDTEVASDEPRHRRHVADRGDDRADGRRAQRHAERDEADDRDRKHRVRVADRDDDRRDRAHARRADRDDDGDRRHSRDRAERKLDRDRDERIADSRSHKRESADDDRRSKKSRVADDDRSSKKSHVADDDRRSKKSRVAADDRRESRKTAEEAPARPKAQQLASRGASQTDATPTGSLPSGNGKPEFRWPARGRVIQGFRPGGNDGINIAVPEGTSVKAVEGGVVAYAGSELKGYGNMVLIRHPNGYVSAYANNGHLDVKRGDTVRRGQIIAKSGQSGNVSAPQLHFELRKGSTPVDPTGYLAGT